MNDSNNRKHGWGTPISENVWLEKVTEDLWCYRKKQPLGCLIVALMIVLGIFIAPACFVVGLKISPIRVVIAMTVIAIGIIALNNLESTKKLIEINRTEDKINNIQLQEFDSVRLSRTIKRTGKSTSPYFAVTLHGHSAKLELFDTRRKNLVRKHCQELAAFLNLRVIDETTPSNSSNQRDKKYAKTMWTFVLTLFIAIAGGGVSVLQVNWVLGISLFCGIPIVLLPYVYCQLSAAKGNSVCDDFLPGRT